jgi:hypothetical protein
MVLGMLTPSVLPVWVARERLVAAIAALWVAAAAA